MPSAGATARATHCSHRVLSCKQGKSHENLKGVDFNKSLRTNRKRRKIFTRSTIAGKRKSIQYWPKSEKVLKLRHFRLKITSETATTNYTLRTIELSKVNIIINLCYDDDDDDRLFLHSQYPWPPKTSINLVES